MSKPAPTWPTVGPVRRFLGRLFLRITGWKAVGTPLEDPKAVLIAAPHTSYWDAVFMLAVAWALNVAPTWAAKHTIFRFPLKRFFRFVGAVPIDRTAKHGVVGSMIEQLKQSERLWIVIAPAGTRKQTDHWKSGFYHVARGAGVKILPAFLDYGKRIGGLGTAFALTDVKSDMDRLRAFYADMQGRHPERKSNVRLTIEDEALHSDQLAS